ncbi:MAG: FecCD family ABC transporter permease, partial [Actinomycetaceae bacterium]
MLSVLGVLLVVAVAASLHLGSQPVPVPDVWAALLGHEDTYAQELVRAQRIPRTLAGIVVGAGLGVAGALVQSLTRNPLADPGLVGIAGGSALAVALAVALGLAGTGLGLVVPAFVGALLVTVAVTAIGLGGGGRVDPVRLVLAGVALTAVFSGITTGVVLTDPNAFDALRAWNVGSLLVARTAQIGWFVPLVVVGVVAALLLARPLDALALGEDVAAGQGVRVGATRTAVVVVVALLT